MEYVTFKKAVPIWEKGKEKEKNYNLIFQETVKKGSFKIRITGSSVYSLFVNGAFLATGPARTAHGFYRVDEHRLNLPLEENTIEIKIEAANVHSFYRINTPAFLCCEILDKNENVIKATGSDFAAYKDPYRVQKTSRYSFQRTFNEVYDFTRPANNSPVLLSPTEPKTFISRGVYYEDYAPAFPSKIILRGNVTDEGKCIRPCKNRCLVGVPNVIDGFEVNELEANPADEVGRLSFEITSKSHEQAETVRIPKNEYAVYAFPHIVTGLLSFEITCENDCTLYLAMDEILEDGFVNYMRLSCINLSEWRLKKGSYKITTAEPYTFMYLNLIAKGGSVTVHNLKVHTVCFPKIKRDKPLHDADLEQIYQAAIETFRQNATDVYTDCPSRERAGWLCDSFFTSRVEYALTEKTTVETCFLENFLLPDSFEKLPHGMLPMCYPADFIAGEFIPNWAMFYALELEEYCFSRNGDKALIEKAKDKMYALLSYFKRFENKQGLLVNLESWIFVEWSDCNDYVQDLNFPTNMLYARTKQAIGHLYNDKKLIREAKALHENIRNLSYFNGFFHDRAVWNQDKTKLEVTDEITETCQYYAYFCGTATPLSHPDLWKTLVLDFGPERKTAKKLENIGFSNAFIGNYLRLELLEIYDESERLIQNIKDYFGFMAKRTGTLWEHDCDRHSLDHGFASHVIIWLDKEREKGNIK